MGGWRVALIVVALAMVAAGAVAAVARPRSDHRHTDRVLSVSATTTSTAPPSTTTTRGASPSPTTSRPPPPTLVDVAFVGDSLAVDLGDAARQRALAFTPSIRAVSDGISGCGVARSGAYQLGGRELALSEICASWPDEWTAALQRDLPKVVVIQVGRHEVLDRQLDGQWTNILEPAYAAYVRTELDTAVAIAGANGREVVLLTAPYFHASSADRPEDDPARVDRFNQILTDVASGQDGVHVIDLGGRASPGGAYSEVVEGIRIRSDGVHYNAAGSAWAVKWLLPQLAQLVAGPNA